MGGDWKFLVCDSIIVVVIIMKVSVVSSTPFVGLPISKLSTEVNVNTISQYSQQGSDITTDSRIWSFGYPVEVHDVVTEDGYILTMQRIPRGKNEIFEKRKPVLFQHGALGDSVTWLYNYPDRILALRLADLGHDVWLANARGTTYSKRHLIFTDRNKEFFDFSMDEVAKYDIPAQIDYILNITNEEKLFYVGLSIGPLNIHMTLSLLPEYNNKIILITSLAPTVYYSNTVPLVKQIAKKTRPIIKMVIDIMSDTGEYPPPWVMNIARKIVKPLINSCANSAIGKWICDTIYYINYGVSFHPDKKAMFLLAPGNAMSTISTKYADHFVQMMGSERIEHYDLGEAENQRVYGMPQPPLYYLKDTTAPVAIFYADNDFVVSPMDVSRVASELSNVVYFHRINSTQWDHLDFVVAHDINELLINPILELFQKY